MNNKAKIGISLLVVVLIAVIIIEGWFISKMENVEQNIIPGGSMFFFNGVEGYYDSFVSASGSWLSDTDLAYPINGVEITCLREPMICIEARGDVSENSLLVSQEIYDIDTWNEKEITTKPDVSALGCTQYSMRFDRIQKSVTATRTTISNEGECEAIGLEPIYLYLGDGSEAWMRVRNKE